MRGRWEVSDQLGSLLKPILRPPRARWEGESFGRYPSGAEGGVLDLGDGGAGAGVAEQVSFLPELPSKRTPHLLIPPDMSCANDRTINKNLTRGNISVKVRLIRHRSHLWHGQT